MTNIISNTLRPGLVERTAKALWLQQESILAELRTMRLMRPV